MLPKADVYEIARVLRQCQGLCGQWKTIGSFNCTYNAHIRGRNVRGTHRCYCYGCNMPIKVGGIRTARTMVITDKGRKLLAELKKRAA